MPLTREQFVKKYYAFVVKITNGTGIFPKVLLAAAIVESQGKVGGVYYPGQSTLAKDHNNYFGVKASKGWKGKIVNMRTREVYSNQSVFVNDDFRKYDSVEDSMKDYVKFLQSNSRYRLNGVFDATSPEMQIKALAKAGYATNPGYADLINKVGNSIEKFFF